MVRAYSLARREVSEMLRYGKSNLVLAHGNPSARFGTFKVPSGTIVVFLSEPGELLTQDVVDKNFYEMFSSPKLLGIPKEWIDRTYVAGSECPNIRLDTNDPSWPGMGLHALPLGGFLAKHPNRPGDPVKDPSALAAKLFQRNSSFRNRVVKGKPVDGLLANVRAQGVIFVAACRKNVFDVPALATSSDRARREREKALALTRLSRMERASEAERIRTQRARLAQVYRQMSPMETNAAKAGGEKRKEPESANIADLFGRLSLERGESAAKRHKRLMTGLVLDQRKNAKKRQAKRPRRRS